MTDEEVWAGIGQGNREALKELYNMYFSSLYSYGLKISRSASNTEDAIHELFIDLWKYREGLSSTTSIKFYLYRALRRKLYKTEQVSEKVLNRSGEGIEMSEDMQDSVETRLIEEEGKAEMSTLLSTHLKGLPERQQESLMLRFYGELSFKEIGEIMDVNEQSARNLVTRGLEFLRKSLKILLCLILLGVCS